jgi:hypothetical protein
VSPDASGRREKQKSAVELLLRPRRTTLVLVVERRSGLIVALVGAFGAVSCGPSFQAVYECDVRFEHCYALDQGSAPVELKKQCWREWLHGYTYGQSGDRIEYAAARFSELSLDPTLPSVEVREAKPGKRPAAPVPTSAFAPPPNLAERPPGDAPVAPGASSAPGAPDAPGVRDATVREVVVVRAPGSECAETCAATWKACHDACRGTACDECDRQYKACVPACFHRETSAPAAAPGRGPAPTSRAMH